MSRHLRLGSDGEAVAAHHYERAGFEIIARNWRCPEGELDVIARRGPLLVVCEVKTRSSDRFGGGAEAVGLVRQRRMRHATARFLETQPWTPEIRFDVAVVRPGVHGFAIEVIEHAF
jgi:putative endonuclease